MLGNGNFSNNLSGSNLEQHNLAKAEFVRTYEFSNSQPSIRITVTNADTVDWYIQINYPNQKLDSNQVYTVTYYAKSSPATNASASVMQAHDPWQNLGYSRNLSLTTNWQSFTNTFQPSASDTNGRAGFSSMGNKLATYWYADVRLQTGGQLGGLPAGASLASRTVPNLAYSGTGYAGTREARRDWLQFLRELEDAYYAEMVGHLRANIGYSGLIFGTIMANSPATVQSRLDVIDGHAYWQHPQFPGTPWDSTNWYINNISMVNTLGDDNTLAGLARQRIKGKPFTVTEYNHPSPNYYGSEGPLLLAAYGALQDWDGLWLFDYGHGNPGNNSEIPMGCVRSYFDFAQHPTKMPNVLLAANLFRRADIRPAVQEITMALTPDRELDLLMNAWAWGVFSSQQFGVGGRFAFTNRLSTSVGTNATGLSTAPTAPTGTLARSDTGELRWDVSQSNQGLVTFDSARSKGLIGYADNRAVTLAGLTLRPATTRLGWCTLGLTLVRGEVFTNDCTALIVATGWWENTNQVWTDSTKSSVGNKWGNTPVLTEVVPFTLTLPVSTNYVQVWALNERGQRKAAIPVTGDSTSTTLTIQTNAGSIWFELQVGRWMASFDLWRARYFSSAELADPTISGETATPDGDRIANLWKYYLGLPGHTLAPADRLPQAGLLSIGDQKFLSMTCLRDKLANDVSCVGQISSNLVNWLSGPAYTASEETPDIDPLQRLTVRDLAPAGTLPARYLRLSIQRQ
jgi:Carbohydrate binding domain